MCHNDLQCCRLPESRSIISTRRDTKQTDRPPLINPIILFTKLFFSMAYHWCWLSVYRKRHKKKSENNKRRDNLIFMCYLGRFAWSEEESEKWEVWRMDKKCSFLIHECKEHEHSHSSLCIYCISSPILVLQIWYLHTLKKVTEMLKNRKKKTAWFTKEKKA